MCVCVFTGPSGKIGKKLLKKTKTKLLFHHVHLIRDLFMLFSNYFPRKVNPYFDVHGISPHNLIALV